MGKIDRRTRTQTLDQKIKTIHLNFVMFVITICLYCLLLLRDFAYVFTEKD